MSKRVAVLMGGFSAEREVSLAQRRGRAGGAGEGGLRGRHHRCAARSAHPGGRHRAPTKPGGGVQRAAWPLRRGRHDPGPARHHGHPLHPFRRAGLGAGDGQADRQAACSPPPAFPCAEGRVVTRAEASAGDVLPRPYVLKPLERRLVSVGVHIVSRATTPIRSAATNGPSASRCWPRDSSPAAKSRWR